MKIYDNGELIAYSTDKEVVLLDWVPDERTPLYLFKPKKFRESNSVTLEKAYKWLENRVTPRTRVDIQNVLRELGLIEYDVIKMIKATEGRAFGDDITIILEEGDFNGIICW